MLPSYAGKILRVDLSTGKTAKELLSRGLAMEYIGGKGIALRLLYDEVKPGTDPLSPESKLIFSTGPATGTILPNKGFIVTFKSPLTNIYGHSSCGGGWAKELKQAGYDLLIVEGRSEKPVYLWIDDDMVQIRDAKHLWGKDTFKTNDMIKEELGSEEVETVRIGPAGEKLVRFACIQGDYARSAGRCGGGAVMGSKNLKAVAVTGTKSIEVADIDGLLQLAKEIAKQNNELFLSRRLQGTLDVLMCTNPIGVLPTRYYQKGTFKELDLNYTAIRERLVVKDRGCHSCFLNCGKLSVVNEGPYSGTVVEGPDYETIFALGSLCENGNLESIAKANELCDGLGIDTISAGNLIAFAMDCYERGIITMKDTEGIELRFGNHEAVVQFVEKIAMRSGLGDILAEGVRIAAQRLGKGAEKRAIHIKGLENPAFDPRGLAGTALGFAVGDRGGCHMWASVVEWRPGLDGSVYEGKAKIVKESSHLMAVVSSMVFCRFARPFYPWKTLERISPLLMGVKISEADFRMIGERIITLARAFNVREGISRKDDTLPERFFEEPIPEGPSKGMVIKKEKFMTILDEYYDLMGWDKNGIPTKTRLMELGLADVTDEIELFRRKVSEVSKRE